MDEETEELILKGIIDPRLMPHRIKGRSKNKKKWKELKKES